MSQPGVLHLRCPHCHNPIELVEVPQSEEVVCPSCGSTFHVTSGSPAASTVTYEPGPRTFDRFELHYALGTGAFGTVWKARDRKLDRMIALKIPRTGSLGTAAERDRFVREARAAAQLRHESIVAVHEVGEHEGQSFIVSEFVDGVSLAEWLTAKAPTFREAAAWVAEVADALQYAHDHGVIHRDVKPSNLILDRNGRLHVMDFGLAKRDAGEVTMTLDGQVLGTPAYMAPEQIEKAHQVDGRADVYALGVVLYRLLTGELPFRGTTRMLLEQVRLDEPRPPRKLNDRIPRDLETVCLKAMAKEPGRRYPTARELSEDLRRFLSGEAIRARRTGRIEQLSRWCRRNPTIAATSFIALIALVAATLISVAYGLQRSRTAEKEKELRIAADLEREIAQKVSAFLVDDLLSEAMPERKLGRRVTVEELLDRAAEKIGKSSVGNPEFDARIHSVVGNAYRKLGVYDKADSHLRKALEIRSRNPGSERSSMLQSRRDLAITYQAMGQLEEAEAILRRILDEQKVGATNGNTELLGISNDLARLIFERGNLDEAEALLRNSLRRQLGVLGENHPDTAASYDTLATILTAQGRYLEAEIAIRKALDTRRKYLAKNHPDTAYGYDNLASNLSARGRHAEAQPFFEQALEIRRSVLGTEHPDTALSYNNVAKNLNAQGKYAQAQPLFDKALEIRRRVLTDEHPATADSYNTVALNLNAQGQYAQAQPLYEKALEIRRRRLTDDHPETAASYVGVAFNLSAQGKYVAAQALFEKALEIRRRRLSDDHPDTAASYGAVALNLGAQGQYLAARDRWKNAVKSQDAARKRVAFTGLDRAEAEKPLRPALAAVLARLGQPAEAWQALEEDLGRGLLDELAARQDRRLAPFERTRLRELTMDLDQLDRLVDTTPKELDQAERATRFEELKRQREAASIALGEFQTKLVGKYGALAGQVARLNEIQAALPADAALVTWVDIPPPGPNAADPDGEHWGVVVRSRGVPAWITIAGTGLKGLWTKDDNELARRARRVLRTPRGAGSAELQALVEKLRAQRIDPLAEALGADHDGLPPVRRLIVLPSRAMAGIPVEAISARDNTRVVSYAPSATVLKYLREQPRPGRHAGLLALGDPVYQRPDRSRDPEPLPAHGLMLNLVAPGSNAATHGLGPWDVLLAYNGRAVHTPDDLKAVPEQGQPVPVEVWRAGQVAKRELAAGELGVVIDARPAPVAIAEQRRLQQVLEAARSGDEDFAPLPGTRYEVEALARLFQSDARPTRTLLGADASETELNRLAASGELGRFGFIHLATHGVIDEAIPQRSALILTQTGLPDPLDQVLKHKPVFDGRLSVREIQRSWDLKAEMVTLSACETGLGRQAGGEGFVGFTQALLMSGARSVCLALWKVDDRATALLMTRFYQNLLGKRPAMSKPMPKAEALREAKTWLRSLTVDQIDSEKAALQRGDVRPLGKVNLSGKRPYDHPHYWAAFVLVGDPD